MSMLQRGLEPVKGSVRAFSTCETEGGGCDDSGLLEELRGREVPEGLMGADGVVDVFPPAELAVEGVHRPGALGHLVEFFGVGPLRPLDRAVELGALRRQDEDPDPLLPAGFLELGEGSRTRPISSTSSSCFSSSSISRIASSPTWSVGPSRCSMRQLGPGMARACGHVIAHEFTESMSAKVPGRPVLNRMLELAARDGPVGLLAWHPDRLARNSVDGGRIVYLLDTGKLSLLRFPTFWFENTPQGKFMLTIAFGQSKYYVDNLIENVWRGIRQKLRRGEFPAKPPVGYLNEPRLRTIVVDPAKAQLARQMFEAYASGRYNLPQLRALVASWGLVTCSGKPPALASVKRLLMNPFYVGLFNYNGELYQGSHAPLIPRGLFERVQQVMARGGRAKAKRKHLFPFVGMLQCGECGCAITAERQKGHHDYLCTKKKGPCRQPYVREESLAAQLRQAVQTASLPDAWAERMLEKIEEWRRTTAQASGIAAQPFKEKLAALKEKL